MIQHGTVSGYTKGCRQDCCRAAKTADKRRERRLRAYGRWQPLVDVAPARARVGELLAAGATVSRVADVAGVARQTVVQILRPAGTRPQTKRVRAHVADALLAVEPWMLEPLSTGRQIDEAIYLVRTGRANVDDAAAQMGIPPRSITDGLLSRARKAGPGSADHALWLQVRAERTGQPVRAVAS